MSRVTYLNQYRSNQMMYTCFRQLLCPFAISNLTMNYLDMQIHTTSASYRLWLVHRSADLLHCAWSDSDPLVYAGTCSHADSI